jgi:hypothetical protein
LVYNNFFVVFVFARSPIQQPTFCFFGMFLFLWCESSSIFRTYI